MQAGFTVLLDSLVIMWVPIKSWKNAHPPATADQRESCYEITGLARRLQGKKNMYRVRWDASVLPPRDCYRHLKGRRTATMACGIVPTCHSILTATGRQVVNNKKLYKFVHLKLHNWGYTFKWCSFFLVTSAFILKKIKSDHVSLTHDGTDDTELLLVHFIDCLH